MRKEYDFTNAKPVSEVSALARLQAEYSGKTRITMRVDSDVLAMFRARAAASGGSYQTMMNEALRQYVQGIQLADVVRTAVKENMKASA